MSDLTLRINADFEKAQKAFTELADTSEATRNKIEKFSSAFQEESLNKFIDKQKLLEASMIGTRGEVNAMSTASNNYKKEIERLIKSGLSPQSEAIQKLSQEQKTLELKIKETTQAQKNQKEMLKTLENASLAFLGTLSAIGAGAIALTNETAKLGDEIAKTASRIGLTAEELQELDYAAKMSGVQDIRGYLDKLNKSVIDVKNNTGNLTKYLGENDTALLQQVKSAKTNSEAFNLLMNAINKTTDPFKKSELAMAAFGKAGQDIILMANQGVNSIDALKEEARKYGIISNEAASQAEKYVDAQTRLQTALSSVRNEIGEALMPIITDVMQKVADAISSIDDWDDVLKTLVDTLIVVTASVGTFLAVMKIAPVVQGAIVSIKAAGSALAALRIKILAVNAAIKLNPIGIIATAIAGAVGIITGAITRAINKQREYTNVFNDNTNAVNRNTQAHRNLAVVTRRGTFETTSTYNDINQLLEARITNLTHLKRIQDDIQTHEKRGNQAIVERLRGQSEQYTNRINQIEERLASLATLQGQIFDRENNRIINQPINAPIKIDVQPATEKNVSDAVKTTLQLFKEKWDTIKQTRIQAQNEMVDAAKNYLLQQAELASQDYNERISFLMRQKDTMLALYEKGSIERIAITQATNDAILELNKQLAISEAEILEERMNAVSGFFSGVSQLISIAGGENRKAVIAAKAFAMVEAGINTSLAATKSLTAAPYPWNLALMAGTIAAGVGQQIKIATSNVPSFETGGRFIVPNNTPRVDDKVYRFNGGEEIQVTPRGGNTDNLITLNVLIDGYNIGQIVNMQARAGNIYTLQMAGNY